LRDKITNKKLKGGNMKHFLFKRSVVMVTIFLLAGAIFTFSGENRITNNPAAAMEVSVLKKPIPPIETEQNVLNWDTWTWYETIQEAINAANPGDRLFLEPITFEENVLVWKPVMIIGDLSKNQVVDGGSGDTFTITANGATIKWLTIKNNGSYTGIKINSNNNFVDDNNIEDCYNGIEINSNSNRIYNNDIQDCGFQGVKIESDNNVIYNNIIDECYRGVYLYGSVTGNVLTVNEISNYENEGILFLGAYENWAYSNTLTGDADENDEELAIVFMNASDNAIYANTFQDNNFGIYIWGTSDDNVIHHNNFIDNSPYSAYVDTLYGTTYYNQWDNGSVGNYWSDHTGSDSNNDGIIDTPYPIPDGVGGVSDEDEQDDEDGYPLVAEWYPTCGNVNGDIDGDITIGDISYLNDYLNIDPKGKPEPVPPCAADVNGDGYVNQSDIDYLIDYLFVSGPAPVENCCSNLVLPYLFDQ
jgi:parallel beta-helix repeat protein